VRRQAFFRRESGSGSTTAALAGFIVNQGGGDNRKKWEIEHPPAPTRANRNAANVLFGKRFVDGGLRECPLIDGGSRARMSVS
jgi:hypothetical protein